MYGVLLLEDIEGKIFRRDDGAVTERGFGTTVAHVTGIDMSDVAFVVGPDRDGMSNEYDFGPRIKPSDG